MSFKLFVGGISWDTTDDSLRNAFAQFGNVDSATIIKDKYSGRSRGFGFVEMSTEEEGKKAIEGLNGKDLDGRSIVVNEARPREDRDDRGGSRPYQKDFNRGNDQDSNQ